MPFPMKQPMAKTVSGADIGGGLKKWMMKKKADAEGESPEHEAAEQTPAAAPGDGSALAKYKKMASIRGSMKGGQ